MISANEIRPSTAGTVLHVTTQSFYYVKRQPARRLRSDESEKRDIIEELPGENITYGYLGIWALVRRQGVFISKNRVKLIMSEMRLPREAHFPRPRLPQTWNLISDVPDVRW